MDRDTTGPDLVQLVGAEGEERQESPTLAEGMLN